jgi:hypothetical protein
MSASHVPAVRYADHDERITDTQQGVRNWHRNNGAAGTFNAYCLKKLEWDELCVGVYGKAKCDRYDVDTIGELPQPPSVLSSIYLATPHKVYAFVFYHAHRARERWQVCRRSPQAHQQRTEGV